MKWNERIRRAREERNLKREQVVEKMRAYMPSGETVSTRTLAAWELGTNEPKIGHAIALAKVYQIQNVTALFYDDPMEALLNAEGQELLNKYRELLLESPRYTRRPPKTKLRLLPLYDIPASAGTGEFLDSDRFEMIEVDDSVPLSADFGIQIAGDSMEPTFANGQTVWVCPQKTLRDGEIGVFCLNGDVYCKELARDENGAFLCSHNETYAPIRISESDDLRVFGKIVG